LTILDRRY